MRITVLSGGVGGARFVQGLLAAAPDADVTVVANTADDAWMFGLRVSPDVDTLLYTLGGGIDAERKWGRADETWNAKAELAAYGVEPSSWFGLGDRDLATHLLRTMRLREGRSVTEVTAELAERWRPGVALLPMTDDEVETWIDTPDGSMHFQEFWVRHRAEPPVLGVEVRGIGTALPTPQVVAAITGADVVLVPPSNPVISVGPILQLVGVREALRATSAPVVGVSPIIGGAAVRGMADQLLTGLGVEVSAAAVARFHGEVLDGWLVDEADADAVDALADTGIVTRAVPLWMRDDATTARLAADALALAAELRS